MKSLTELLFNSSYRASENLLLYWRGRVLSILLLITTLAGMGLYTINVYNAIQDQSWEWIVIYTICYFFLILITFSPEAPYSIRAGTLLAIIYLLGSVTGFLSGFAGDVRIWLIGFSTLTALLFGLWPGLAAVVLSSVTYLTLGFGFSRLWIRLPEALEFSRYANFTSWLSTFVPFFIVSIALAGSIGRILSQLQKAAETNAHLAKDLTQENTALKKRTSILERRENQLRTAAEITRILGTELDPSQLYSLVVNLIKERFDLYYVGIFTVDEDGRFAVLQEGTGEEGKAMVAANHKLAIGGTSMIGWAISRRQPRIALDVGREAVRFENPHLPLTRSEMALPFISGSRVLGALTVQSKEPQAFDENDIVILQSITDGLAIALENASLFEQTEASLDEVRRLHQQYLGEAWSDIVETGETLTYTYHNPWKTPNQEAEGTPHQIVKPIVLRDQVIGKISLETDKAAFSEEENIFLETITSQAAQALENVRLLGESQRNAQRDRFLADLTGEVWASPDPDTILKVTLSELVETLQATDGTIQILSQERI